jgi:hypothetical protein
MLKRFTIWFLIFAVFAANFSLVFVYVGFNLNRQYIAANLCINRFKPSLHCNGKCYFMRKLKQAEDNDKKQAAKNSSGREDVSFFQQQSIISFIEPITLDTLSVAFPASDYQYTSHYLISIFRPPKPLV